MTPRVPAAGLLWMLVASCGGCLSAPEPLPPAGHVSSLDACGGLVAVYFAAEGRGLYACDWPDGYPHCPWPTELDGCPRELDGECVPAVCDPASIGRTFRAALNARDCYAFRVALDAADEAACR